MTDKRDMRGAVLRSYGDASVIEIVTRPIPKPKPGEILIKLEFGALTTADSMMRQGRPKFARVFLGLKKPKNPNMGTGFYGEVVSLGEGVQSFKLGDKAFGESGLHFSANSEYLTVSENEVVMKAPKTVDPAVLPVICDGPLTSYNFLMNHGKIKNGQRILVNGGAGALGVAAIQLAALQGLTVVATASHENHEHLKSLGAKEVYGYKDHSWLKEITPFDLIFDAVGKLPLATARQILTPNGSYLSPVLSLEILWFVILGKILRRPQAIIFDATGIKPAKELRPMVTELLDLIQLNKLRVPITRVFSLDQVCEAHSLIDKGQKRGNFILKI